MVAQLLADLDRLAIREVEVLLTVNVPEDLPFSAEQFGFPLTIVRNRSRKGFGVNHNAGFRASRNPLFCVLNPDVRLPRDPFPELARRLQDSRTGIVAPLVRTSSGRIQASARRFPTPLIILRKALFGPEKPGYGAGGPDLTPDWVGGMFMLFRRETFVAVGGFDERYYLYYEDVDICARVRMAGKEIVLCPSVEVVHDAQRRSHKNLRYVAWHIVTMLRFFTSRPFARLVVLRFVKSLDRGAGKR